MKRIITLTALSMLLTLVLLFAASCGKNTPSGSSAKKEKKAADWRDENEIYAKTYAALKEAFPGKGEGEFSVDDLLKYDSSKKIPYFEFDDIEIDDEETIPKAAEAVKPVWDGQDVPMFGVHPRSIAGEQDMFTFFESFDCKSLALTTPVAYVSEFNNSGDDYHGLSRIKNLKTLVIDADILNMFENDDIEPCTSVTDLTVPGSTVVADIGTYFPNTEKVTLLQSENLVPNITFDSSIERSKVTEVTFCKKDGKDVDPSIETIEFFERMKNLDQIKKINGVAKDKFEIPMTDELKAEYEKKVNDEKNAEISQAMNDIAKSLQLKCATKNEEGTPALGNKIIALVDNECSGSSALKGEDFYDIPNDRLAKSVEEADTYLFVYDYHEVVGSYSNGGGNANRTYTMVITVDKNGENRAAHVIGVTDPPEQITIQNGIGFGGSGEFLIDDALAYVKTLL
ncbi:MAG: hypothetical protein IIY88_05755 [Eubacterium sp.]|nr:hypothetical protein [Eubacterium sp.]